MNFKSRALAAALVAGLVSACANDQAYLKAQADAITAQSTARVEEAKAATAQAKAVERLADKIDAGGAAAYLLATALKGMVGAGGPAPQAVQRPRDWVDYLNAGTQLFAALGSVAVPIVTVKESNKTQRYLAEQNVAMEGIRQGGESTRFSAATGSLERLGTAGVNADRGAHTSTTITAGGDVANNGSSIARITCEATGGNWVPTVPPANGTTATTAPPGPSGSAGAGTCTQR